MEELAIILMEIRDSLSSINNKLDNINTSISSLKGINACGSGDSLADICEKLDSIGYQLDGIESDISTTDL